MRKSFYFVNVPLFLLTNSVFATKPPSVDPVPPRVNVDGTWYNDGDTAYIECSKTSTTIVIDPVFTGSGVLGISVETTANFSSSDTPSSLQKTLNLDPNSQNGHVDVGYQFVVGDKMRVYIQQKPPEPIITAGSNVCAGNSGSFTAISNYDFQSTKPINLVWQTTGGVTVNGSNSYTEQPGVSSTVTIANGSSGSFSVKAVIAGCSSLESTPKTENIGAPVIANPNYWLFDSYSNMWQFSQSVTGPGITYTFYVSSGTAQLNQQLQDCYITTTEGATVCVTGTNSCGTGTPYCFYIPPASGLLRTVYPNPVTNLLTLEFNTSKSSYSIPFEVILYSEKSMKAVKHLTQEEVNSLESFKTNHSIEMDVADLPRGIYYLHTIPDKKSKLAIQKTKIIIE
ncbi:T9SS type A sorting domain-containing protein [Cyclobacterium xiamenense]|uniref:T9SS type A sorting domain-containing protein n=1 Tax=Cyclobacterium xiamenense TaxID=1297121 RepID=UPI0012B98616|nr:T9SS type A sorting domain-containing protein [Cyclobacterium xiamenense]